LYAVIQIQGGILEIIKNPSLDFKNYISFDSYEFLAILEGEIRKGSMVQSGKITVCIALALWQFGI
jgi:hypothetical protein